MFEFVKLDLEMIIVLAAVFLMTPTVFFALQRIFDWGTSCTTSSTAALPSEKNQARQAKSCRLIKRPERACPPHPG